MSDLISRQAAIDAVERAKTARSADGEIFCAKINAQMNIQHLPSAQPEIVRCKDCKHWKGNDEPIPWDDGNIFIEVPCETKPTDFCSMGERKEDDGL